MEQALSATPVVPGMGSALAAHMQTGASFFFFFFTPSHGDRWRCEWVEEAAGRSWLEPDPVLVPKRCLNRAAPSWRATPRRSILPTILPTFSLRRGLGAVEVCVALLRNAAANACCLRPACRAALRGGGWRAQWRACCSPTVRGLLPIQPCISRFFLQRCGPAGNPAAALQPLLWSSRGPRPAPPWPVGLQGL